MIVQRGIKLKNLIGWSGHHMIWLVGWAAAVAGLYDLEIIDVELPWLPVSIIGTAVAFYVGFKNNSAYDRMWEAPKNLGWNSK